MNPRYILLQIMVPALVMMALLATYHRLVLVPTVTFGVVDVAEVYQLKEKQLFSNVNKAGTTDADKQKAITAAVEFAKALPKALEELPAECKCVVLVRNAVAAQTVHTIDLTPSLRRKIGV